MDFTISLRKAIVGALLLAAVAVAAFFLYRQATKVQLWVVNPLDVPLDVTVDGERVHVPPKSTKRIEVPSSELEVVAKRTDGKLVDRVTLDPSEDRVAYNVLGAATFTVYGRHYSFHGITMERPRAETYVVDQRIVERPDVHYFLEPPPEKIVVDKDAPPGTQERIAMSVSADWRVTVRMLATDRPAQAKKLVEAIAAAEPEVADAQAALQELQPKPPPREKTKYDWSKRSLDSKATLEQRVVAGDRCDVRCTLPTGTAWEHAGVECIARDFDDRFVTADCTRAVVVRRLIEGTTNWRDSPVVFFYAQGKLEATLTAGRFVQDETALAHHATGISWMFGGAGINTEAGGVLFKSADKKPYRVPLIPE